MSLQRWVGSVLKVSMLKCDLNIHHCHLLCCLSKQPFSCKAFFHFFILYWITGNEENQKVCSNILTKCEVRLKHLKVCKIRQSFPLLMVLPAKCWYLTTGSAGPWAGRRGVKELCQLQCSGPRAGIQSLFLSFPCTRMKTIENTNTERFEVCYVFKVVWLDQNMIIYFNCRQYKRVEQGTAAPLSLHGNSWKEILKIPTGQIHQSVSKYFYGTIFWV